MGWTAGWAAAALLGTAPPAAAEPLARYQVGGDDITLSTERCGGADSKLQRASRRIEAWELAGCWVVNEGGNPVVLWSDGRVQELDQARVTLAPRYAAMLRDAPVTPAASASQTDDGTAPPSTRSGRAASAAHPRPAWCGRAGFPHERRVCADPALAAADLALAPLWQAYRTRLALNDIQQARIRSDYFQRLKACGAQRACIAREQAAQERLYRQALERPP